MKKDVKNMSVREYDEHCEKAMSCFLDKYFYSELENTSFERVDDRERQICGIDIILTTNKQTYNIDEKAAIRYTNGLKTFALELSFLDRGGKLRNGWLIDDRKINDYYVFVWINKIESDLIYDVNSFKDVDVALVAKSKIMEHLSNLGWNKGNLMKKQELIRNGNKELGNLNKNGCKFSFSTHLREKPINILLKKETYLQIADITKHIIIV